MPPLLPNPNHVPLSSDPRRGLELSLSRGSLLAIGETVSGKAPAITSPSLVDRPRILSRPISPLGRLCSLYPPRFQALAGRYYSNRIPCFGAFPALVVASHRSYS